MKMKHKFMKKILLTIVAALPLLAAAQARIAIVDSKAVFDVMPAKAAAEAQLKAVTDAYQAELDKLRADFDSKFADYQASADDASTPATIKERRMQEVMEGDKKIHAFEKAAKADITARRDSLMAPIEKAIHDAIKAVGDEGEYDLVLDTATTPVAYAGSSVVDLTAAVMAKLGL